MINMERCEIKEQADQIVDEVLRIYDQKITIKCLRDLFAGIALHAMMCYFIQCGKGKDDIAGACYEMADAMMGRRKQ